MGVQGSIQQVSQNEVCWNLQINKSPPACNYSGDFTIFGCKHEFHFLLERFFPEDSWSLQLRSYEKVKLQLDMHVNLLYKTESKDFSLTNQYFIGNCMELTKLKPHGLLRITCTFFIAGEMNKRFEAGFSILSEDLKNAFLSEEDSDIIFKVRDKIYPAHKVVIRNRSTVFRAMLEHDMMEKKDSIINIDDCDACIFQDFLFYLYSGKLNNISYGNVFELYYISDKYDVNQLKLDCVNFIMDHLSTDIIVDAIVLATKHSENNLLNRAIEFFVENAKDICVTMQWQEFLRENPTEANELIERSFKSNSKKR